MLIYLRISRDRSSTATKGKEYAPDRYENPDHMSGPKRIGAYIYETIDPYSGNILHMVGEELGVEISPASYMIYTAKAFIWIFVCIIFAREKAGSDIA